MTAYYNEFDPYAAQWLRNLIAAGQIAAGDVDERSIKDVKADDLKGYTQAHFFAGIGGWSIALRQAGWDDARPVWTGSCPCQPFSAAGAGKAFDDERHLWPAWFPLIAERRPAIVFGEQVDAAIRWGWLDAVLSDLEGEGYACGATVLPACGVGAPHIRQRLWFVADADGGDASAEGLQRSGQQRQQPQDGGAPERMAESESEQRDRDRDAGRRRRQSSNGSGVVNAASEQVGLPGCSRQPRGSVGDTDGARETTSGGLSGRALIERGGGPWTEAEWIECRDGKRRPIRPGSFPLGHGIQRRASKLRAYGNAIVPQVAAEFIIASSEALGLSVVE